MKERFQPIKESALSVSVDIDPEEEEFGHLVQDWVQDKISYKTLMRNLPSHMLTIPERVLRSLSDKISAS